MVDSSAGAARGSSARKLRATGANLLPGRSVLHRLYPLTSVERPAANAVPAASDIVPMPMPRRDELPRWFPAASRPTPALFEQWIGIELWKRLQYLGNGKLHYQRTKAGREVDFVIARERRLIPIEIRWTERPTLADARHLLAFLNEHPRSAPHGYVVCRCPHRLALHERVTAIPWSHL